MLLVIAGAIGFAAACALTLERMALLDDPSYVPKCDLNPIVSCGSVMQSEQARAFGFPNSLVGVAAFPMLVAAGSLLLSRVITGRWFWLGLQAGVTFGIAFVGWLFFQSVYRIGALCPYCMVVWAVTLTTFWYVTRRNLLAGAFGARIAANQVTRALGDWHVVGLTVVVLSVLTLILERFWYYWQTVV